MEYLTGRGVGALASLATVATGLAIGVAIDETDQNESDGILYRGMRGELMPEIGPFSAALGIRDPKDIPMQHDGRVLAGDQGLSVVPDNPSLLLKTHLREQIEKGKVKIWGVYRKLLDPRLTYRPDPSRPLEHGYIGPTTDMPVGTFKQLIEETQRQWSQLTD